MSNPMMIYFPFGGRGELSRLAAAAGGVELDESPENDGTVPAMPSRNQKKLPLPLAAPFAALVGCPSPGVAGANFLCVVAVPGSFFGALPTLKHGDVELCQSQAITMYLGEIGPKFAGLAAGHKGVDAMYTGILEDVLAGCAGVVFGDHSTAGEVVPAHLNKFFTVVEGMLPASGFINGLDFPTIADCAVLCMTDMMVPIGIAMQLAGGYDLTPFPKMLAISSATKASPEVAAYLAKSATLTAMPKM
jgi:glutathione S-transferase